MQCQLTQKNPVCIMKDGEMKLATKYKEKTEELLILKAEVDKLKRAIKYDFKAEFRDYVGQINPSTGRLHDVSIVKVIDDYVTTIRFNEGASNEGQILVSELARFLVEKFLFTTHGDGHESCRVTDMYRSGNSVIVYLGDIRKLIVKIGRIK